MPLSFDLGGVFELKQEIYLKMTQIKNDFDLKETFFKNGLYLPSRTIFLGQNDHDDGSDICHADVLNLMKSLELLHEDSKTDGIKIFICTCGGSPYHAFAIYDLIRASPCPVTTISVGECMSSGTIILLAGDTKQAYPNCRWLIHDPSVSFGNDEMMRSDLEAETAENKKVAEMMMGIYADSLKIGKTKIKNMMKKNSYFGSTEALEMGMIDKIIGY